MAQSNGDEVRKELERLYKCVVYDRIDDVDRMELWIKEVGIVVEELSAIDRKQHELDARIDERSKLEFHWEECYDNAKGRYYKKIDSELHDKRIAELKAEREAL